MARQKGKREIMKNITEGSLDKIMTFTDAFWKRVDEKARTLIQTDSLNGKLQGGTVNKNQILHSYKDADYMKRKASGYYFDNSQKRKAARGAPKRITKRYLTAKNPSTRTSSVDMRLSGVLMSSLQVKNADANGVELEYTDQRAEPKIEQAERYGRDITTLRDKNKKIIKGMILKQFRKNIRQTMNKVVRIEIG